ncbi:hypothetical protein HCN44_008011 [Aphidius gifuensis]|uniref:Uncharacterized protein n=1 Tax=Aphidius gifuensis TaxID=684658 RepID=A0A834XLZ7_APHGI|nr:uncharacterized protein LOC122857695 [Aphidius gifuensis]KAF7989337.1 hypothetical protein HCN44_008011 [Aphidius gifuensis]
MLMKMLNVNYLQVTIVIICYFQAHFVIGTYVKLTHDGPTVQGGSITFKAEVFPSDDWIAIESYTYRWNDNGQGNHHYKTPETKNTTSIWKVDYPADIYPAGEYSVEVEVHCNREFIFSFETSQHSNFEITTLLNGNMTIAQSNHSIENNYVSSDAETEIKIDLRSGDYDYITKNATELSTYWFIDCQYYGQTNDFNFKYNFTNPNTESSIEALIVASYEPLTTPAPPTTTTTTTTTTTPAPTTTSTTTTTTIKPTTTSSTTTPASKNTTTTIASIKSDKKIINKRDTSNKVSTNKLANNITLPYVCINTSIVTPDPKKTYGYFHKKITINEPIKNISVNGSTWIQPWNMLYLNVSCHGSGPFVKCIRNHVGNYNITGNETCNEDDGMLLTTCNFSIKRYFFEPNVYTVLVMLRNNISTQIYPITINIYKVTPKPQLSVIVVPITCSVAAVVLIVFGVAYYIQSRSRCTIEVANFDFGQSNPDMEYKTFTERLKDSFNSSGYKTLGSHEAPERQ